MRSTWKGHLQFGGLVTAPVKMFSATEDASPHLNQLHRCGCRIQQRKHCPQCGGEVKSEDIVSGYEHCKGQYVTVDDAELEALYPVDDRCLSVVSFIDGAAVDPMAFNGKCQYLAPDGVVAERTYALLRDGLGASGRVGLVRAVVRGREHLYLLKPVGRVLALVGLKFAAEMRPAELLDNDVEEVATTEEERQLVAQLIDSHTDESPDLAGYRDTYAERLASLVASKAAGVPVATQQPPTLAVASLMDALRASVAKAAAAKPAKAAPKPRKPRLAKATA